MAMREDRGQAITLSYTLGIAIATLLVTGLLIAGAGFVTDQREQATRTELRVIGQQLAADMEAADRLVNATESDPTVSVARGIPQNVAGVSYTATVVERADPYIRLHASEVDVTVRVEFTNTTEVAQSRVSGGQIRVNYTAAGRLRLERGDR